MKRLLIRTGKYLIYVTAGLPLLSANWPWDYVRVNMPVSLAVGQVKTPEFKVKNNRYIIEIVAKRRIPFADLCCMMGLSTGPLDRYNCKKEPIIQANWTVWSEGRIVAQGHPNDAHTAFSSSDEVGLSLGEFDGKSGKLYSLEVDFIKDGSALNVTDPHLKVETDNVSDMAF